MRPLRFAIVAVFAVGCTRTDEAKPAQAVRHPRPPTEKSNITIKGSDTMVILGQTVGRGLHEGATRATTIQVTGGGSGTGIAALINGSTDICESSRPMKDKEKEDVQGQAQRAGRRDQGRARRARRLRQRRRARSRRSRSPPSPRSTSAKPRTGRTSAARRTPSCSTAARTTRAPTAISRSTCSANKDFAAEHADARRNLGRRQRGQRRRVRHRLRRHRVPRGDQGPQGEEGRRLAGRGAFAPDRPRRQLPHQPLPLLLHGGRARPERARSSSIGSRAPKVRRSSKTSDTTRSPRGDRQVSGTRRRSR